MSGHEYSGKVFFQKAQCLLGKLKNESDDRQKIATYINDSVGLNNCLPIDSIISLSSNMS